jgi:hypothetical protein
MIFGVMDVPKNVIVNADDLGLNPSTNAAILHCFIKGYINSASLLTNTVAFDGAVSLIHQNPCMQNIGVHINFAEGKPILFNNKKFLDDNGCWNIKITNKIFQILNVQERLQFLNEIYAQIDRALENNIILTHLDSHYHLHTLPCFFNLFIRAAKHYKLKVRLAQTYREGSYIKYWFRIYLNQLLKRNGLNYTTCFETVERFVNRKVGSEDHTIEVMLHPDFDINGVLTDHTGAKTMKQWLSFLSEPGIF